MNDDHGAADDDQRPTSRHHQRHSAAAAVPTPGPPAASTSDRPVPAPPSGNQAPALDASAFDYGLSLATGDMYVVPFGLENGGGVAVGMSPGYVPMDPAPTPGGGLFQSLPSISAIQSAGKFYPPSHKQQPTGGTADFKDDRIFQLMTSSSSSLPVGDSYSHHHYDTQQQQQQGIGGGGYGGEMTTSMMTLERAGVQSVVGGSSFLPRCFGGASEMLPGYVPCQPAPASVYCDGVGVLPSYGAAGRPNTLDQFVNFVEEPTASAAVPAVAGGSYAKPVPVSAMTYSLVQGSTSGSAPTSSHVYNQHPQQQHQHHQLNPRHHQLASLPSHYYHRLPYPTKQPSPSPPNSPPSTRMPPCRDVTSCAAAQQPEPETDEINTRAVAGRVAAELKRYSVPQAVFAQLVLCRSQGTLSDLLRNPKPWSKLKSGRETFRRMWKWLQEPEYQRMSALRFAGRLAGQNYLKLL